MKRCVSTRGELPVCRAISADNAAHAVPVARGVHAVPVARGVHVVPVARGVHAGPAVHGPFLTLHSKSPMFVRVLDDHDDQEA